MLAGRFRHVLTVQTKTETQGHGGVVNTWAAISGSSSRRCSITPVSAFIRAQYQQKGNPAPQYQIKFRHPLNLNATAIRFIWNGKTLYPSSDLQNYEGVDLVSVKEGE